MGNQTAVLWTWHGQSALERFMLKVNRLPTGCWEWTGARNVKGYGTFRGRMAHRWLYEHLNGTVGREMQMDHFACDNKWCVNPEHVRPVTARENSLRSDSQGARNLVKTHCPQGHPLSGDNLIVYPSEGRRRCRACKRAKR